jgi:hypothetical protein
MQFVSIIGYINGFTDYCIVGYVCVVLRAVHASMSPTPTCTSLEYYAF